MSDRLEDLGVPPKLLMAIRNEVRSNTEQQLNDLWMVVHSLKDLIGKSAPSGEGGGISQETFDELKTQVEEVNRELQRKLKSLRKWVEGQSGERSISPEQAGGLAKLAEKLEKLERETGQLGGAAALFESRLVDQETRILRRLDETEARMGRIQAQGVASHGTVARAEVVDELSTDALLSLPGQVDFSLGDLAKVAIKYNASDLVIRPNSLPYTYLEGDLIPIGQQVLSSLDAYRVTMLALSHSERRQLVKERSFSKLVEYHSARFLLNAYFERGELAVYARRLSLPILSLDQLDLPRAIEVSLLEERGFILLCGNSTGALKSLAYALLAPINQQRRARIFTLEEAIQFELPEEQSLLSQLQRGVDVSSPANILRLRPDVLYLQGLKNFEEVQLALTCASERTLVIATCTGSGVVSSVQQMLDLCPSEQRNSVLSQLGACLRSVLCYRDPQPSEYLINSAKVRPWLEKADFAALQTAVEIGQAGKSRPTPRPEPRDQEAPTLPPPSSESLSPLRQAAAAPAPAATPSMPKSPLRPPPEAPPAAPSNESSSEDDDQTLLGWL
jgi:twitching motility protein PilT